MEELFSKHSIYTHEENSAFDTADKEADNKLKDLFELSRLYDIYGSLLNDHNRVIFEDYVLNNYSLGEIASDQDISRQGVRDTVMRCSKKLRDYERKLGFLKKMDQASDAMDELSGYIESSDGLVIVDRVKKLLEI
ncbi:MAG: DNA-binding protein [Lachnospiraceae bacterium]|nr:DNA-binding protein [Lachnospiraceae bacterium]